MSAPRHWPSDAGRCAVESLGGAVGELPGVLSSKVAGCGPLMRAGMRQAGLLLKSSPATSVDLPLNCSVFGWRLVGSCRGTHCWQPHIRGLPRIRPCFANSRVTPTPQVSVLVCHHNSRCDCRLEQYMSCSATLRLGCERCQSEEHCACVAVHRTNAFLV